MKLVVVYPQGRLGNQLFQYAKAKSLIQNNDRVLLLPSDLSQNFLLTRTLRIPCPQFFRKQALTFLLKFLDKCIKYRILPKLTPSIDSSYVDEYHEQDDVNFSPGIISPFPILKGYFQNSENVASSPQLKTAHFGAALQFLSVSSRPSVGIHFRFGDYETFTIYGSRGTTLPLSYYRKALDYIESKLPDARYIIISDDLPKAAATMNQLGRAYETSPMASEYEDLALLQLVDHLIISNSSFAYWGVMLSRKIDRTVVAPLFWLGFKTRKWYPVSIRNDRFTYIDPLDT